MYVRFLGALELIADRRSLDIGGPRQRTTLAILALNANRVTPVEQLVDAVWNTAPPETARAQIQTCISGLRKLFCSAGRSDVIDTYPQGYLLKLTASELDSEEFAELVAAARRQADEGQLAQAATTLRKALNLWRGLALADEQSWQVRRGGALLKDRRLSAIEERVRLDLALGSHKEIVDELAALVREYPLRERLYGFLMLALYRSGRQAEALEVRRRVRTVLVEELGIEPGRELQELERAILNRESSLDWQRAGVLPQPQSSEPARPAPAVVPPMVPHELPFSIADFTGREELIQQIRDILVGDSDKLSAPYSMRIVAISGRGGVGKSSLAVRVAHELMDAFPDGHLYGDFLAPRGSSAGTLLARFLRAMGVSGSAIPEDLDERARMYRSTVARNRVLVVLDDVTSEDQVLPLLPGSPLCAVLVTSRTRLSGLPGAVWTDVEPFETTKSIELLPRIRNWHDLIFYRPDARTRYQHIDALFGDNAIDWGLIEKHWTDLLRTAISIREGRVSSVTLLRRLGNHSRKNRLYRAFRELGRVIRTITLLRYLSEPELREQITAITNKAEAFHGYSEWLMVGGKLIGHNDPEHQELVVKFNELMANCAIYSTALDITDAANALAAEGHPVDHDDLATITPYITHTIRRLGDLVLDLDPPDAVPTTRWTSNRAPCSPADPPPDGPSGQSQNRGSATAVHTTSDIDTNLAHSGGRAECPVCRSHVRHHLGRRPSAPWTWSTAWQLRGVDSSEVGRVQALANAR